MTLAQANLATCYSPFLLPAYGHIVSFRLFTTFYLEFQTPDRFSTHLALCYGLEKDHFSGFAPVILSVVSSKQNLAFLAFGLWPITFRRLFQTKPCSSCTWLITFRRLSCNQIIARLAMANGLLLVFSLAVLALAASGPAIPWHAEEGRALGCPAPPGMIFLHRRCSCTCHADANRLL